MRNKIIAALLSIAALTGVGLLGATPAEAHSYSFTTYCTGTKNPKILVSAPSYVWTSISGWTGYGTWSRQFAYDGTFTVQHANGEPYVDYICV